MKIVIAASLYVIGIFVYAIWSFGEKGTMQEMYKEVIEEDPDFDQKMIPEWLVKIIFFIAMLMVCLPWPVQVIAFPFRKKEL